MSFLLLDVIPTSYSISYTSTNTTDAQTCEVVATLAPHLIQDAEIMYGDKSSKNMEHVSCNFFFRM
jgi:hypothetical protein